MIHFQIKEEEFYGNGKKELLLCGEIHYFRMPRENWAAALDRLVECGCNAVAYYVPWFVHEFEEGNFDFTGRVHPENDLHTWIRLTAEKGLMGFLRPGPYVYAETADLGIPLWFQKKHPNAQVKRYKNGEYTDSSRIHCVGHNHPDFLSAVEHWYAAVCGEIKQYLAPLGNLFMIQLCNEIPGDDHDDRNPENLGIGKEEGIYPSYLREKYCAVETLNQSYRSDFRTFEEVEPHMLEEADPDQAFMERLEFYYSWYYPGYFRRLRKFMLDNGVETIFVHNAYNPRAVSLHYRNRIDNPWLHVGLDCYYSLSGRLGMKEAAYYGEFGAEYARRFLKDVPWVIEHECGYWNDYPTVYGPELYIWNIWAIASGYRGFNLYLFASGLNRDGMGFFGTAHDWQAPVDYNGEKRQSFKDISRSIRDIKKDKEVFLEAAAYDIGLGLKHDPGLIWKRVAKPGNETYFALKSAGYTPRIVDFMAEDEEELKRKPVLFLVLDEALDAENQRKLAGYVREGGTLIVSGRLPYKDDQGRTCTILADELKLAVSPAVSLEQEQEKLRYAGTEYYIGKNVQRICGVEGLILGETTTGGPGAVLIESGKGKALILPFEIEVLFKSMGELLYRLLERISVYPQVRGAVNLRILVRESGTVIALNMHPIPVEEIVFVNGRKLQIKLKPHSYRIITNLQE